MHLALVGHREADDTAGFAPLVKKGPKRDANFLAALDADPAIASTDAVLLIETLEVCQARRLGGSKRVTVPPVAQISEKEPNVGRAISGSVTRACPAERMLDLCILPFFKFGLLGHLEASLDF